jgi:tryptophan synthase beta chain
MFVPETLMTPLLDVTKAYDQARRDPVFQNEFARLLRIYAGRPTGLYLSETLTRHLGGAKVYLKREDMLHTGAHKINNVIGQALLAKRMGKTRIISETGAGQHGTATAAVCARFGLKAVIYMGEADMERQALNVYRMRLMGALDDLLLPWQVDMALRHQLPDDLLGHINRVGRCIWRQA